MPAAAREQIEVSVVVAAPPREVWEALTTTEGLRGWWAPDVVCEGVEGGRLDVRFDVADALLFQIVRLEPNRVVSLLCAAHESHPEWAGTTVRFGLVPVGDQTRLELRHEGWRAHGAAFDRARADWERLMPALRAYVLTGSP